MQHVITLTMLVLATTTTAIGKDLPYDSAKLIPALIQVESRGNDSAIGDNGNALGCLQIWKVVIDDVNRVYGLHYVHADAYDRVKAQRICKLYLQHYCNVARLGRDPTMEDACRIWNGGPNGYKKSSTIGYWVRVQRIIKI